MNSKEKKFKRNKLVQFTPCTCPLHKQKRRLTSFVPSYPYSYPPSFFTLFLPMRQRTEDREGERWTERERGVTRPVIGRHCSGIQLDPLICRTWPAGLHVRVNPLRSF